MKLYIISKLIINHYLPDASILSIVESIRSTESTLFDNANPINTDLKIERSGRKPSPTILLNIISHKSMLFTAIAEYATSDNNLTGGYISHEIISSIIWLAINGCLWQIVSINRIQVFLRSPLLIRGSFSISLMI